jgi:hypothetical protein
MRSWYLVLLRETAGPPLSVDLPPGQGAFEEGDITEDDVALDVAGVGAGKGVEVVAAAGKGVEVLAAAAPVVKKPKEKV